MKFTTAIVSTLGFLCIICPTSAYPDRVPDKSCDSMLTGHTYTATNGTLVWIEPQWWTDKYEIRVDKSINVQPGESIRVCIKSREGHSFKGFLAQAFKVGAVNRGTGSNAPTKQGQFQIFTTDAQLACWGKAASHTKQEYPYTKADFIWNPPSVQEPTRFHIMATVLEKYETYYAGIESGDILVLPHTDTYDRPSQHSGATSFMASGKNGILVVFAFIASILNHR